MSQKVKKQASSVSFSLSRWFRRISTAKPSTFAVSLIVIASTIFFLGGGIFTITNKPLPSAYVNGQFYFLYPNLSQQFISDTIISVMLYAIGFAGVLIIYQSTKYAYKPRQAYIMLFIGVALLFLAYVFLEESISIKLSG